jgi:hypothetical protein
MLVASRLIAPGVALAAAGAVCIIALGLLLKVPATVASSPDRGVPVETPAPAGARNTVRK